MLRFPRECVGEPVISNLVRRHHIEVNLLHARIHPSEEGRVLALVTGTGKQLSDSLEYLRSSGVEIHFPENSFIWQERNCVHCGACAGICPSNAFSINSGTFEVEFAISRCILCELCIDTCYYGAIQSVEDYIRTSGVNQ